jgi:hypothetical protein
MEKSLYQELLVWQKAMSLAIVIYKLVKKLPKEELYSLSDQMDSSSTRPLIKLCWTCSNTIKRACYEVSRAVVSIPSKNELIHFLAIARGSKAELETQLLLCVEVGYLEEAEILESMNLLTEIGKMLNSLINKSKS